MALRWARYRTAQTVDEYITLGGTSAYLRYDFKRGHCWRTDNDVSKPCLICGAPTTYADDLSGDPPIYGTERPHDVDADDFDHHELLETLYAPTAPAMRLSEAMPPTPMRPENQDAWVPAVQKQMSAFHRHDTLRPVLRSSLGPGTKIERMGCGLRVTRDGTHKARVYLAQKRGTVAPVAPGEAGASVPTSPSPSPGYTAVRLVVAHAGHYEHDLPSTYVGSCSRCARAFR